MKYLFYKKETETRAKVGLIYYVEPPIELGNDFILVENLEKATGEEGKVATLYCNPTDKSYWYEYTDRTLTPEEQENQDYKQRLTDLETQLLLQGGII